MTPDTFLAALNATFIPFVQFILIPFVFFVFLTYLMWRCAKSYDEYCIAREAEESLRDELLIRSIIKEELSKINSSTVFHID